MKMDLRFLRDDTKIEQISGTNCLEDLLILYEQVKMDAPTTSFLVRCLPSHIIIDPASFSLLAKKMNAMKEIL